MRIILEIFYCYDGKLIGGNCQALELDDIEDEYKLKEEILKIYEIYKEKDIKIYIQSFIGKEQENIFIKTYKIDEKDDYYYYNDEKTILLSEDEYQKFLKEKIFKNN